MADVYISTRSKQILRLLIATEDYISVQQLATQLNLSKRSAYYELCKVNDWLIAIGGEKVEPIKGKGIILTKEAKEMIIRSMDHGSANGSYVFSPMERIYFIICYIIRAKTAVSVERLSSFLQVSRNTIFNDIRVVVKQLQDYDLLLEYKSKEGYVISGDSIRVRAIYILYINKLRPVLESGGFAGAELNADEDILKRLQSIEGRLNISYEDGILIALASLIPVMTDSSSDLYFADLKQEELKRKQEYKLVEEYFPELQEKEKIYLCLHLLGSRVLVNPSDVFDDNAVESNYELTKALIAEFEKIACVFFQDREELERSLYYHLTASLYRLQYGIQIGNLMMEDIVREYPNLFELTRLACHYLEQQIGLPIPDGEIAYIALHFGAHLRPPVKQNEKIKVLIVCTNGVSAGNMIRHEVLKLLPEAEIVGVVPVTQAINVQSMCDIVISTAKMNAVVPVIVVHPILTDFDRNNILNHSLFRKNNGAVDVMDLYTKLSRFVPKENQKEFKTQLFNFFGEYFEQSIMLQDKNKKGLLDYLNLQQIHVETEPFFWEKSIKLTGQCLVDKGSIENGYIEKIITQIRYYGPYMFIAKDIVLAHVKPEDGVNEVDISMSIFHKPVRFPGDRQAKIILVMAAMDQEKHLKILSDIMTVFSADSSVDMLTTLETPEEVWQCMKRIINRAEKGV